MYIPGVSSGVCERSQGTEGRGWREEKHGRLKARMRSPDRAG